MFKTRTVMAAFSDKLDDDYEDLFERGIQQEEMQGAYDDFHIGLLTQVDEPDYESEPNPHIEALYHKVMKKLSECLNNRFEENLMLSGIILKLI